jgi:multimeric flavodoxin WrbA
VELEIVTLNDYNLRICRGCRVCFEKGEAFCPLKDDRDLLMDKIKASDGVIFATPNYCFQLSGVMKVFIDRFGYAFHRPCYFGKAFTSIVSQGFGGGGDIIKYLDLTAKCLGFKALKGIAVTGFDPKPEHQLKKIDRSLAEHSRRFYALLTGPALPVPSMFQLMIFRMSRCTMREEGHEASIDYKYFAERGWFTSDYYYPTRLGLVKNTAGYLFDTMAAVIRNMI